MSPQQVTKEGFSLSQAMGASGQDKKHAACQLHVRVIPYRIARRHIIPHALPQVSLCPRMATISGESSQEAEHEVWKSGWKDKASQGKPRQAKARQDKTSDVCEV
jgi:hypothetical protein